MKIAYVTLDEVHEELARQSAEAHWVEFCALPVQDLQHAGEFDAVIYDLDYLPEEQRLTVMAGLLSSSMSYLTAVHSFNLRKNQVRALRRRGVIVGRTPESALSKVLRALAARAASPATLTNGQPVTPREACAPAGPTEMSAAASA